MSEMKKISEAILDKVKTEAQQIIKEDEEKGFDIVAVLGNSCILNLVHNTKDDKTYTNIASISPLMKGMKPLEPENPAVWYSTGMGAEIPVELPDWIHDKIKESIEYKHLHGEKKEEVSEENPPPEDYSDEENIPF